MGFAYLLFAITLLLQPLGQILERLGMRQIGTIDSFSHLFSLKTLLTLATNPFIIGGVICSAIGLLLWLGALSHFNVSYLYPLGALSYIVLAILAHYVLGEAITVFHWTGILLIVAGATLLHA